MYLIDVKSPVTAVRALTEPVLIAETIALYAANDRAGAGAQLHAESVGVAVVDEIALCIVDTVFVALALLSLGDHELIEPSVVHSLHGERLPLAEITDNRYL